MPYPYNTIFRRGLLNTFEAALVECKASSIFGSQQEARNIEKSFAPGHKNVYFLQEQSD
jgi:hypothetical protein